MPNGGVPMHMVLYSKDGSPYVLYLRGGVLALYDRPTWDADKSRGTPLLALTESEGAAIAWFLKYWLGDAALMPGYKMGDQIAAEFDF